MKRGDFRHVCRYRFTRAIAALVAALLAAAPQPAAADTITDDRGLFADVTVIGMDNGAVLIRFRDGRELRRDAWRVRTLAVGDGATPGANELSRADALRSRGEREPAVPLYERARQVATAQWVRDYATWRLIECHAAANQFDAAMECYLAVVEHHPALVVHGVPRPAPAADSVEGRRALERLDALLATTQTESLVQAIGRLRRAILREDERRAADEAGGGPRGGRAAAGDRAARRARALPRDKRPTTAAHELIASGRLDQAYEQIQRGLPGSRGDDRLMWRLAEAEYRLARRENGRARLAAMKVLALGADSPYAPEALLLAGRANEPDRPDKARQFYEECLAHRDADGEVRRAASERLKLLPPASTQPAGTQPTAPPAATQAAATQPADGT